MMISEVNISGLNHFQQQQVDAIDIHSSLVVVATSRLEGSTWDGAVTVLRASKDGNGTIELSPEAGHVSVYGISSVVWCGSDRKALGVAQDNGDVELYMLSSRENIAEQPEGGTNEDASGLVLEPVVRLMEHDDLVSALAADTTSNLLASGSWDRSIRIWNVASPMVSTKAYQAHRDHITALTWGLSAASANLLASASKDRTAKVWDVRNKAATPSTGCIVIDEQLGHTPLSLDWMPQNDHILAMGLENGTLSFYDIRKPRHTLISRKPHAGGIGVLRFSPSSSSTTMNGSYLLATGGDDASVTLTEVMPQDAAGHIGESTLYRHHHKDYVRAIGWLEAIEGEEGASILLTGGWDGHVKGLRLTSSGQEPL